MKPLLRFPYSLAGRLTDALVRIVPAGSSKFRRGLSRRRGLVERYAHWGATSRDISRPLVWFHAPSVGEGLQAQPVIDLLRARRPDVQIAYTFYSPSAEQFATTFRALETAFDRRFQQLFGGGFARLSLTDPGDLSATGIEIVAKAWV